MAARKNRIDAAAKTGENLRLADNFGMPGIPLGAFVSLILGVRCTKSAGPRHPKIENGWYFVSMEMTADNPRTAEAEQRGWRQRWSCMLCALSVSLRCLAVAQTSASQPPSGQGQASPNQPSQNQTPNQAQSNDIPDAPTVQPRCRDPRAAADSKAGRKEAGRAGSVDEPAD